MKIGPNAVLSFVLEMIALGAYIWAPFALLDLPLWQEIIVAVVAVAIFVFLWARFAAPNSSTRLSGVPLLIFKVVVLFPALALITYNRSWLFFTIGVVSLALNLSIEYLHARPAESTPVT